MTLRMFIAAHLAIAAIAGCEQPDSNRLPQSPAETWQIDTVPVLRVGMVDGPQPYLFSNIVAARLSSTGHLVVADGRSREIRIFDDAGRHVRTIGGRGSGPGEFSRIGSLVLTAGDTILTVDPQSRRVVAFDPSGNHVHTTPLVLPRGFSPTLAGVFSDGSLALWDNAARAMGEGLQQDTTVVVRMDYAGQRVDTLVRVPGLPMYGYTEGGRIAGMEVVPFSPRATVALTRDRLLVAEGREYRVDQFPLTGEAMPITRTWTPSPVTQEDMDAYRQTVLARNPALQHVLAAMPYPSHHPAIDGLTTDLRGNVWVRSHTPASPMTSWDVFDIDGGWLARVELPRGWNPASITDEHIVFNRRDADGIEFVQVHRVLR